MPIRINLTPPINPERISRIRIYRSLFPDGGFSIISDLNAHDGHGHFVSVYEDPCGNSTHWYKVGYVEEGEKLLSYFVIYKDSEARQMFVFPEDASIHSGGVIIIGYEETREEFEDHHGLLPEGVSYYGSKEFMKNIAQSYVLSLYDANAEIVTDMTLTYEHTNGVVRVEWQPRETKTEAVRLCQANPVQIIYSIPDMPKDWQVDTIYIMRSDSLEGEYEVISKTMRQSNSEYGPWKTSFVDLGGSATFFYKVVFTFSRWNDQLCKSEFHTSCPSAPMSPILIDGNLVAKITDGHLSINDMRTTEQITFKSYPYCGYHRYSPQDVFKGTNASPYSRPNDMAVGSDCGGSSLFGGPLNIYERNLQQQQMLLETTGENVILLRRKWDGRQCPCMSKTEEHPINKCPTCFGTGFVGGYDRIYFNDNEDNPDGRILLRFYPTADDLALRKYGGLDVVNQPNAWTIAQPIVRDRDIIVQFDPIDKNREIWRYEVLDVTRNAFIGGVTGAQVMRLQRLNRLNDTAYNVPLTGTFETELWDMQSNIHNSYGHQTGLRSGHRISVDEDTTTTIPDLEHANMILDAYSRKIWPFIRAGIVPAPQMVLDTTGPLYPMAFINSGGNDLSLTQINSADTTINNFSVLRYVRVEIGAPLSKECAIVIQSVNDRSVLTTFPVPKDLTSYTYSSTYVFKDTVKLMLNQSVRTSSLVIMLVERS
jgi:hypothetical protein